MEVTIWVDTYVYAKSGSVNIDVTYYFYRQTMEKLSPFLFVNHFYNKVFSHNTYSQTNIYMISTKNYKLNEEWNV